MTPGIFNEIRKLRNEVAHGGTPTLLMWLVGWRRSRPHRGVSVGSALREGRRDDG